jgi:hypothetical protein
MPLEKALLPFVGPIDIKNEDLGILDIIDTDILNVIGQYSDKDPFFKLFTDYILKDSAKLKKNGTGLQGRAIAVLEAYKTYELLKGHGNPTLTRNFFSFVFENTLGDSYAHKDKFVFVTADVFGNTATVFYDKLYVKRVKLLHKEFDKEVAKLNPKTYFRKDLHFKDYDMYKLRLGLHPDNRPKIKKEEILSYETPAQLITTIASRYKH